MALVARVAVDKTAYSYDQLFSYLVPASLAKEAAAGRRVLVPFGQGNGKRQGMIFSVREEEPERQLKPIAAALDSGPLLSDEMLRLSAHLRNTVFCSYYEAVRLMIPSGLDVKLRCRYRLSPDADIRGADDGEALVLSFLRARHGVCPEERLRDALGPSGEEAARRLCERGVLTREEALERRVLDEKIVMVRLCASPEGKLPPKQRAVAAFLEETGTASLKEICYYTAVTRTVVDNLQKKGVVEYYERETYRSPKMAKGDAGETITLSETQQAALDTLLAAQRAGKYTVSLLFGVTGSGKTQVFLRLARQVLREERGVLVLVPEIALTPQTIALFHAAFGPDVAVMHSALSLGERLDEYKRIARGEARVVVGTRSAVFAPVQNLGLIIIDEEQEGSYKSEKSPRYHARDVARWRAHYHHTQLVLASATPSVESFYYAKKGVYQLVTLTGRRPGSVLPDVYILDESDHPPAEPSSVLSAPLTEEMRRNLERGEQSVLLLNRRGYHTLVKCASCAEPARCPNCSVTLTYHSANGALCCHYCGYMRPKDDPCPLCGGKYERYQGAGTQRVEEELHTLFPAARILRMDMDTTMQKFSHERAFAAFAAHEYDVMIGTQMVAKGLDFPDVTLVGVLCTDLSLYSDDYRSFERTFSLITQAVGRAGRGEKKGRAYIQTYSPENPVIELAGTQQYERFFGMEIRSRRLGLYPPYCTLCALGVTGEDEEAVREASGELLAALEKTAGERYPSLPLRVLGPSDFSLYRMAGRYRRKILIKCRNNAPLRAMLRETLELYGRTRRKTRVNVFVDMYYDSY